MNEIEISLWQILMRFKALPDYNDAKTHSELELRDAVDDFVSNLRANFETKKYGEK